ncbi:diacylglycerol/lipid kinase family protein [Halpernia frigidisoli]|uniref:Lipid kinase, YegS/Rv2252/BmrU family n=1 Tax=Halpernia frigidisoli TaxID=1125876 RepID=A0A1I3CTA1_9FLAO|nr:diacylglycerol kinase family protein [Halpernia frigidisoli]SFH77568.1 lipid kinase, YegS/Rv2252/BmrU family [Halpernia frigidisoli]
METGKSEKILFIINPGSGSHSINWSKEIETYFKNLDFTIELYLLEGDFKIEEIKEKIEIFDPQKVVAVGGDGTISLVAECLLNKDIAMGILPSGSANGMAKELGISEIPQEAINTVAKGVHKKIHVIMVNGNLCIHLSDVGFNAWIIKEFEADNTRGFFGYFKANLKVAWNVLFINPMARMTMQIDGETVRRRAGMVVIANAREYGIGAVINPIGDIEDDLFEIVIIKKISVSEVFKMLISHKPFNPHKIEILQAQKLNIKLSRKMHFQVDGEYLGKVTEVEADIVKAAITLVLPK